MNMRKMRLDTNASTPASKPGHTSQTAASRGKKSKNPSRNIYIYLSAVIAYSEYKLNLIKVRINYCLHANVSLEI